MLKKHSAINLWSQIEGEKMRTCNLQLVQTKNMRLVSVFEKFRNSFKFKCTLRQNIAH